MASSKSTIIATENGIMRGGGLSRMARTIFTKVTIEQRNKIRDKAWEYLRGKGSKLRESHFKGSKEGICRTCSVIDRKKYLNDLKIMK